MRDVYLSICMTDAEALLLTNTVSSAPNTYSPERVALVRMFKALSEQAVAQKSSDIHFYHTTEV